MNYNNKVVFDELSESFVDLSSEIDDDVVAELFGENYEVPVRDEIQRLGDRISAETSNLNYDEAVEYFNENLADQVENFLGPIVRTVGGPLVGWVADKLLGGGSSGTAATSTNSSTNISPNTNTNTVSPVINYHVSAPVAPSVTQAPVQNQSASASSRSGSSSRSQTSNRFNPQFNPSLQFNPYLQFNPQFNPVLTQLQLQQQQQLQQQLQQQYGQPVIPQPNPYAPPPQPVQQPCNCPPVQQYAPAPAPQVNQQLSNILSDPRAMATLTNLINANLAAATQRPAGAREGFEDSDDDTAEFLPILGAIASAVVPSLIQAAPSIVQGVGRMFSGRRRRPAPQRRPVPQQQYYRPAPQPMAPAPPPPPQQAPMHTAHLQQVAQQQATAAPSAGSFASNALNSLISLIQNPQITAALGNLVQTGVSAATTIGSSQVPVGEAAFLNAISEYARMAEEELESLGSGDNLEYMRDDSGQWKYDPNVSTYRAEALVEAIQS